MSHDLEMIKGYCSGGLSTIPELHESSDYMLGYRRALENVLGYVELLEKRARQDSIYKEFDKDFFKVRGVS